MPSLQSKRFSASGVWGLHALTMQKNPCQIREDERASQEWEPPWWQQNLWQWNFPLQTASSDIVFQLQPTPWAHPPPPSQGVDFESFSSRFRVDFESFSSRDSKSTRKRPKNDSKSTLWEEGGWWGGWVRGVGCILCLCFSPPFPSRTKICCYSSISVSQSYHPEAHALQIGTTNSKQLGFAHNALLHTTGGHFRCFWDPLMLSSFMPLEVIVFIPCPH